MQDVLLVLIIFAFFSCGSAVQGAGSRLAFSYARDGALPGSTWISEVSQRFKTPANALFGGALVTVVFIGLAALALPGLDWTAAAWLLPAFALTVLTLAVSTVMEPVPSAVGVALWWVVSVALVGHLAGDGVAAFHADGQVVCVVLIAVAGLVLARRSEAFERGTWA